MAKGKYEYWLTTDGLTLLEGWARDGLTDEQIASNCGVTATTLYDWKNRFPEISEALKKGKEVVDYEVENALLKKAMSGDITAAIFWLKNRRSNKWRDKPVQDSWGTKSNNLLDAVQQSAGEDVDTDELPEVQ